MGLTDDELRARMLAEAEVAIEKLLAHKKGAEEITLTEIEQLVLAARQEVGEGLTAVLIEESARARVPGVRAGDALQRAEGETGHQRNGRGGGQASLLLLRGLSGGAFSPWMSSGG
jgi:hypothetical protein